MSGNMSLQSDVNLVHYQRCDCEHYLHDIFFLMYSFLLSVFPVSADREKQWLSSLKKKVILFWSWRWEYFSLHFKLEKSHSSMDIKCKVYYNVVLATDHGFWLLYCFVLAAALSWHVWWHLLVCFCLTEVKHGNFLPFCCFTALWALWVRLKFF